MTELSHQPCPYEDCGSSDAFNYNTDGYGFCQSCKTSYPSKKPTFEWAKEEYPVKDTQSVQRNREPTSTTFKGIRSLDEDVAKLYGIQRQDFDDGSHQYAFKYPTNVKYRNDAPPGSKDKKFWTKHKGVPINDLFGPDFNAGSSNRLYLSEGECDAAALYQALGKSFPVKGLPTSSINEKFLKHNNSFLSSFKELVYAGELDDAGRKAADLLYNAYPDKFYYVPLTKHKDASDFLDAGDVADLKWAALKPQRYTPDNFFTGDDAVEKAIREENPYEYVPTGHSGLDDKMRGLVKGGITFIKAKRGMGKTELARYFETAMLKSEDTKIALLHAEEMKSTTYRAMATYHLGVNVRTKDDAVANSITEDQVVEASKVATKGDRTIIFEMRGSDDPMRILDYIRLAAAVYGAEFVFIDHIQRLAYLSQSGVDGATSMLTALGSRMAQICKELNIGVICISQVNDDGRTKYSAALEEEAIICIALDRDVESEDERIQNTTEFVLDKNRPFSKLGKAGKVFFDTDTTILTELVYDA